LPAAEAARLIQDAADPRGFEVIIPRQIKPSEVKSIRAVNRVVGWRYYPEAKGKKPFCGCPSCTSGLIRAKRLRVPKEVPKDS